MTTDSALRIPCHDPGAARLFTALVTEERAAMGDRQPMPLTSSGRFARFPWPVTDAAVEALAWRAVDAGCADLDEVIALLKEVTRGTASGRAGVRS